MDNFFSVILVPGWQPAGSLPAGCQPVASRARKWASKKLPVTTSDILHKWYGWFPTLEAIDIAPIGSVQPRTPNLVIWSTRWASSTLPTWLRWTVSHYFKVYTNEKFQWSFSGDSLLRKSCCDHGGRKRHRESIQNTRRIRGSPKISRFQNFENRTFESRFSSGINQGISF